MKRRPPTALYFTSVVAIDKDLAFFAGHLYSEKLEPTMTRCLFLKEENWGHLMDVDEVAYAAARKPLQTGKKSAYCVMGRTGHYYEYRLGSGVEPAETTCDLEDNGYLMDLRFVGGHLYACGVQNQVFRQKGAVWSRADRGAFVPLGDEVNLIFNSIDGFSEEDMYAAGFGGDLWRYDGSRWSQLDSPTNYTLNTVLCGPDGLVYLAGGEGRLFAGTQAKGWRELSDPGVTEKDLEGMTAFQGRVYIAADEQLLSVAKGKLSKVEVPVKGKTSFYRLDAASDAMWSVGDECILRFDGTKWTRYVCPDNE